MNKVDEYINELPKSHKENAITLRNIILQSSSQIRESYKYKCPFYSYKKNLCYFYVHRSELVLGLVEGAILAKTNSLLVGNQKQVRHIIIKSFDSVFEEQLRYLLQEAILLNQK